jgi:hypothetical protein
VISKRSMSVITVLLVVFMTQALFATVPCSELKTKIDDGLKAKGIQSYSLTIVPMADAADGKVVGTCDGGANKIVYSHASNTEPAKDKAASPAEKKPAAAK